MTMKITRTIDKVELAKAVVRFAKQKPGFDTSNYIGASSAYRSDYYTYKKDAEFNRRFGVDTIVEILRPLDDETIRKDVYSRLEIEETETGYTVHYTAGQYYCTEYQNGLKATLKSWINGHLAIIGLKIDRAALETGETLDIENGYAAARGFFEDGELYVEVNRTFAGQTFKRRVYVGVSV